MKFPIDDQDRILDICKENSGYCDCEILMNAASLLLNEKTPW